MAKRIIQEKAKFSNVDVMEFMEKIVNKRVQYYKSDFDTDKEILKIAASKQEQQEKTFVWLCRTCGTWIFHQRNVFLKDTREYDTVRFYMEQTSEPITAFVIEVTGLYNNRVMGNMYSLNYDAFCMNVTNRALVAVHAIVQYENGIRIKDANANVDIFGYPDEEYGKFQSLTYHPYAQEELTALLHREKKEREHFPEGNPDTYISML